jgi:voltage-gated potassium channel
VNTLLASPLRNLLAGIVFILVVMAGATAGYVAAGWSFGDAIYMVTLTVYTVGFDEVRPIDTPTLRALTMTLMVLGCTGMIFVTGALINLITFSQFQQIFGLKRMQSDIDRLHDHVIVCGFGRIGMMLARELHDGKMKFVVVERSEQRLVEAREHGYLCLQGDGTEEASLLAAGIERARCLATVLPDDAANVFITLTARGLNKSLTIIARGEEPTTENKLLQAGANRVVLPTHIGAERIAEIILFPEADRLLHGSDHKEEFARDLRILGMEFEIVAVAEGSRCAGQSVEALEREAAGAFLVVAINRHDGSNINQPPPDTIIAAGDGVVVLGRPGRARMIDQLFHKRFQRSARG